MRFVSLILIVPFCVVDLFHKHQVEAAIIDIQGCSTQHKTIIRNKVQNTQLMLQEAAERLRKLELYFENPTWKGGFSGLTDTLASTAATVAAFVDGDLGSKVKGLFQERAALLEHIRFLDDLARTISHNITPYSHPGWRFGSSRRIIQLYCGDEWLLPTQPPKFWLEDNRPQAMIAYSEDNPANPRVRIYEFYRRRPFSDEPDVLKRPVAFTLNGLSGPYESVISLNSDWVAHLLSHQDSTAPDLGLFFKPGSRPTSRPGIRLSDMVRQNLEATLIHELCQAVTTAQNDEDFYKIRVDHGWDDLNAHLKTHPLPNKAHCGPQNLDGFGCAQHVAKSNPSEAVNSALNFMYLVMALGMSQHDWSTGIMQELSKAKQYLEAFEDLDVPLIDSARQHQSSQGLSAPASPPGQDGSYINANLGLTDFWADHPIQSIEPESPPVAQPSKRRRLPTSSQDTSDERAKRWKPDKT